jgi:hypothetical protein
MMTIVIRARNQAGSIYWEKMAVVKISHNVVSVQVNPKTKNDHSKQVVEPVKKILMTSYPVSYLVPVQDQYVG